MVFLLAGDVMAHSVDLRKTNGENAVAILPREIMQIEGFLSSPRAMNRV